MLIPRLLTQHTSEAMHVQRNDGQSLLLVTTIEGLRLFRHSCRRLWITTPRILPLGSGEVEAANIVLETQRLKRSGQSWDRDCGQGVLPFVRLKSDRFDRACLVFFAFLTPKKSELRLTPLYSS